MKKQTSNKSPRPVANPRKAPYPQVVKFPQARGRTVEMVELIADADYHCISIRFRDKTDLSVVIDPALRFNAEFYDWKTKNPRVLKRWPTVRSEE